MSLRVNTLSGNKLFNFSNGMMRITTIVEKIDQTTPANHRPLQIHSAEVAIPESGISLPLGTIKGINREINDVFNSRQDFATSTIGKQVLTEKSVDITFAVDANQMMMDVSGSPMVANNVLYQMFASGGYKLMDNDGVFQNAIMYKVAGTNGTVKRNSQCKTDMDFKGLFWRDGMLAEPQASDELGELLLTENTRVTAYNNFNLCVMLEFIYKFSDTIVNGVRFPYASCGEPSMEEAEDYNKYKFTANLLSDSREINKSFIEGISKYEDDMYAVEVQYFVGEAVDADMRGVGATKPKSVGIFSTDKTVGSVDYKAGDIYFGSGVLTTTGTDYLAMVSQAATSTLRNNQYIKIYVRGNYSLTATGTDEFANVADVSNGYILAKVAVQPDGRRRLKAVLPRVNRKGEQVTDGFTIVTDATPVLVADYNTKVNTKDFVMPVFDWDYDLTTMSRFTLDN